MKRRRETDKEAKRDRKGDSKGDKKRQKERQTEKETARDREGDRRKRHTYACNCNKQLTSFSIEALSSLTDPD